MDAEPDDSAAAPPSEASPDTTASTTVAPPVMEMEEAEERKEARLHVRQTNGEILFLNFGAKESLGVVRLYLEMNR